jgi:hypothetical protein
MLKRSSIMAAIYDAVIDIIVCSLHIHMEFLFVCYPLFLSVLKFNFSVPLFYLSTSIYLSLNCSIGSRTVSFAYHRDNYGLELGDDRGTLRVMCGVCGCVRELRDAISVHGIF